MRLPALVAGSLLCTACIQSVAPIVVPSLQPTPASPAIADAGSTREAGNSRAGASPPVVESAGPHAPAFAPADATSAAGILARHELLLPVAGASADRISDSFDEPRDGGRVHRAMDILAPRGTPILSADDGRILRLSTNPLGGITVYATDATERFVYYYAHLDAYRHGLAAGAHVTKGDTLGYVGTTGNAPKDTPHLHFQIMQMPDDGKYWIGDPVDPFPLFSSRGARLVEP